MTGPQPDSAGRSPGRDLSAEDYRLRELLNASTELELDFLAPIGSGGAGTVWRARGATGPVAVKLLGEASEERAARFELEARSLSRIDHPNVVRFVDAGTVADQTCLVMEWIDGPSLDAALGGPLTLCMPWHQAIELLLPVAEALALCHSHGLIHRDVKPSNIVIEEATGRPVLVDFGLAKRVEGEESRSGDSRSLTQTGEFLGTPAFMAPEQLEARGELGKTGTAADVWGFAATLFRAMAGRSPLQALAPGHALVALAQNTMPRLRSEVPAAPARLDALLAECLDRAPEARPDMAEVARRLRELVDDSGSAGRRFGLRGVLVANLIAVLLLSLILAVLLRDRSRLEPLRVLELAAEAKLTRRDRVMIRGRLSRPGLVVEIAGSRCTADAEGRFEAEVRLKREGPDSFPVVVPGQPPREIRVAITRDTTAPGILFEPLRTESGEVLIQADGKIHGLLSDDHGSHVLFGGSRHEAKADGRFEVSAPTPTPTAPVTLVGVDLAGNQTEVTFTPITAEQLERRRMEADARREREALERERERALRKAEQARFASELQALEERFDRRFTAEELRQIKASEVAATKAAEAWRERHSDRPESLILSELTRWSAASVERQDEAIRDAARQLGAAFRYRETRSRELAGVRLRIATFEHRKTGLRLQLLPGVVAQQIWWANPEVAFVISELTALASSKGQLALVVRMLISPPYQGFNQQAFKIMGLPFDPLIDQMPDTEEIERKRQAIVERVIDHLKARPERLRRLREFAKRGVAYYARSSPYLIRWEFLPPLLLGQTEVSRSSWTKGGGEARQAVFLTADDSPVSGVLDPELRTWLDRAGDGLRLPTRAEWSYGWTGGLKTEFFWGDDPAASKTYIWSTENIGRPQPVTAHLGATNLFGLADMSGNVEELVDARWDVWAKHRDEAVRLRGLKATTAVVGDWAVLTRRTLAIGGTVIWPWSRCRPSSWLAKKSEPSYRGLTGFRVGRDLP